MPDAAQEEADRFESSAGSMERVVQSSAIWLAAGLVAPGVVLGPLLAARWRPSDLPLLAAVPFWGGAVLTAAGLALLIWAGCPVIRDDLVDANRRKMNAVRAGIPLEVGGLAIALLLSPR